MLSFRIRCDTRAELPSRYEKEQIFPLDSLVLVAVSVNSGALMCVCLFSLNEMFYIV